MKDFEDQLRSALQREEPPPGFAGRVMSRTGMNEPRARSQWRRTAAAIAACALVFAGGFEYRQYQGRKASRELLMALEITSDKLNIVQRKVSELNRRVIHE